MGKAIYKLVDAKGRILIPKALRDEARISFGDIVALGISEGSVAVRKVDIVEVGDESPEAVEAYVRAAIRMMPDTTRLGLLSELTGLLQKKESAN